VHDGALDGALARFIDASVGVATAFRQPPNVILCAPSSLTTFGAPLRRVDPSSSSSEDPM